VNSLNETIHQFINQSINQLCIHQFTTIASDIDTESSLTTGADDLTAIHAQSGLETAYTSRKTKSSFLVAHDRLPGFVPTPPSKRAYSS